MQIRVYQYGLLGPTSNADMVLDQMRKAHVYRNLLTEIERARRDQIHQAMTAHPDMAPLQAEIDALVAERDAARQQLLRNRRATRSRSDSPQQRAQIRDQGARIRVLRQQIKDQRKAVAEAIKPQLDQIQEVCYQQQKDARARCGVYWGTYLLAEADAKRARMEKTMPRFRSWRGEGRVSVQIQNGISVDDLLGGTTQVALAPVAPEAHDVAFPRGQRRRAQRTAVRLRIGSDGRDPIWATWPMIYHRPLPPGSRIKVATVSRRIRDCRTWTWTLHLTVEIPDDVPYRAAPVPSSGIVALNLGFCQRDDQIRAGYLVGDDGSEWEVLTPRSVIDALSKASSIQSYRDKWLDKMKAALGAWYAELAGAHEKCVQDACAVASEPRREGGDDAWSRLHAYIAMGGPALPHWLHRVLSTIAVQRSPARFRALAFHWRQNRFHGDEVGFRILESGTDGHNGWRDERDSWRYRDEHLERYQSGMRRRAHLRRRETYRLMAAQMAARYQMLAIDDSNLSAFQRSPAPEHEKVEIATVKHNQVVASPSELRLAMVNAFGPQRVLKVSPRSLICASCGATNDWDRATPERQHTCTSCGASWDQDANACRNMLRESPNLSPDKPKPKTARAARPERKSQAA